MDNNTIQVIDKLKEVMQPVADKIGQGAQFGWGVVLRQQYVTAYLGLFWMFVGVIGMLCFIALMRFAIKGYKKSSDYNSQDEYTVLAIVSGIFTTICTIIALSGATVAITHFLNPDYYAIKFFLDLVKK